MKKLIATLALLCLAAQGQANGVRVHGTGHFRSAYSFSSFRIATAYAPVAFTSFVPYAVAPVVTSLAVASPYGQAVVADTCSTGLGYSSLALGVGSYGYGYGTSAFAVGVHRTFLRRGFRGGVVNPLGVQARTGGVKVRVHR